MLYTHQYTTGGAVLRRRAQPRSLAGAATENIRRRIVDGDLKLGQALSETTLAAELGISKTPIREALVRLESEGLELRAPQLVEVPVPGGTRWWLVTFDGTQYAEGVLGYGGHGDVLVMREQPG